MHKFPTVLVTWMLAFAGCRSDHKAAFFHPWGWEDAKDARTHLDAYKHVLVACVYDSHWENRGPHELTPYHFRATVVRSFKGDWRVSERIAFVHYVDSPAPAIATSNTPSGNLVFIFTNEHTDAEIVFHTGDFARYGEDSERVLEYIYPPRRR